MMSRAVARRIVVTGLFTLIVALPVAAEWPPKSYKNLKVLPKDMPQRALIDEMASYTRALGVRCTYCHVGEEGKPLETYQFDLDDKANKKKAREMILMTRDINEKYLADLHERDTPPTTVQCMTCHRGVTRPRMLQDVLMETYEAKGLDSTIVRYQALRDRYYGRAAYDFGEVPLGDVATKVAQANHPDDAVRINALNVEMNPKSAFAKRMHATAAITQAYRESGAAAGTGTYEDLQSRYGPEIVSPQLMDEVGARLLASGKGAEAVALFERLASEDPNSANAWVNLGDAYAATGNPKKAKETYQRALKLDPASDAAKQGLEQLKKKK